MVLLSNTGYVTYTRDGVSTGLGHIWHLVSWGLVDHSIVLGIRGGKGVRK